MKAVWKIPPNGMVTCRVTKDHQASFSDPLAFACEDVLAIEDRETIWKGWIWCVDRQGKGGWVPEDYVDRRGDAGTALRDYDAVEMSVNTGDILEACEEAKGWLWCEDRDGNRGWVPATCVEPCKGD